MLVETLLLLIGTIVPYHDAPIKSESTPKTKSEVVQTQAPVVTTHLRGGWDYN